MRDLPCARAIHFLKSIEKNDHIEKANVCCFLIEGAQATQSNSQKTMSRMLPSSAMSKVTFSKLKLCFRCEWIPLDPRRVTIVTMEADRPPVKMRDQSLAMTNVHGIHEIYKMAGLDPRLARQEDQRMSNMQKRPSALHA